VSTILLTLLLVFALSGDRGMAQAEDDPGWNCHTQGNLICGTEKG